MKRWILSVVLGVAAGLTLSCSSAQKDSQPGLAIGIKYDQPGLSVMGSDGRPQGFDIDVATYIAKQLGVDPSRITWKEAQSDKREGMINSGDVDFVVASYSIDADRKKSVAFAGPYFIAGQDLLVRSDNTDITRPETLNGKSLCSATGSTSAKKIAKDFSQGVRVIERPTYSSCVEALLDRTVDAVTTDDVILAGYAAQHRDKLRVVGHPFTRERYGVGLKQNNKDLQKKITDAIAAMIRDGSWQRAVDRNLDAVGYHGFPAPPFFNASNIATTGTEPEPELTAKGNAIVDAANAGDFDKLFSMVNPDTKQTITTIMAQYLPINDTNIGGEIHGATFHDTLTGVRQTGPDSGILLIRTDWVGVPDKYRDYAKDVNFTCAMSKVNGTWQMRGVAGDFVD